MNLRKLFDKQDSFFETIKKVYPDSYTLEFDSPPEIPISESCGSFYRTFNHGTDSSDIYNVETDFDGTYPDVLEIQDTFLKCILARLSYYKRYKTYEEYEAIKYNIFKNYGNNIILNFNIKNLNNSSYARNIFEKYNSVKELNLKEIWEELNKLKEKLDKGEIQYKF